MLILIIGLLIGVSAGLVLGYKYTRVRLNSRIDELQKLADKHLAIMNLFSMWIQNKESNLKIETYLKEKNINRIAIYGMSFAGERLYDELENSDIEIAFCIDKNANNIYKDVIILSPDDEIPDDVDAIIVTAFTFFEEIEMKLKSKVNTKIISLDDIVYSL